MRWDLMSMRCRDSGDLCRASLLLDSPNGSWGQHRPGEQDSSHAPSCLHSWPRCQWLLSNRILTLTGENAAQAQESFLVSSVLLLPPRWCLAVSCQHTQELHGERHHSGNSPCRAETLLDHHSTTRQRNPSADFYLNYIKN